MPQDTQATQQGQGQRMTGAQLLAEVDRLRAENAALAARAATPNAPGVTFKVSGKGAVSAYGLGRFPVTLYASQWEKLAGRIDDLKRFIVANEGKVARKS